MDSSQKAKKNWLKNLANFSGQALCLCGCLACGAQLCSGKVSEGEALSGTSKTQQKKKTQSLKLDDP